MKQFRTVIALLLTVCFLFACACAKKPAAPAPEQPKEPATETAEAKQSPAEDGEVGNKLLAILDEKGMLSTMGSLDGTEVFDFFGIDPEKCTCIYAFRDAENAAAEFFYAESDPDYIREIETILKAYLSAREEEYKVYDAETAKLIKNGTLINGGTDIFMVVSPDAAAFTDAYKVSKG